MYCECTLHRPLTVNSLCFVNWLESSPNDLKSDSGSSAFKDMQEWKIKKKKKEKKKHCLFMIDM